MSSGSVLSAYRINSKLRKVACVPALLSCLCLSLSLLVNALQTRASQSKLGSVLHSEEKCALWLTVEHLRKRLVKESECRSGNLGEDLRKQEVGSSLGAGRKWAKYRIGHLHDFYLFRGNGQSCDWLRSNSQSFIPAD